ncbi:MAG: hypothetical protein V4478_00335 [Patescibacteria group bacterium]
MVEISLLENGNCYGYTQFFHGKDSAEPFYITDCFRCIGLIIIWKRRPDCDPGLFAPKYAVSAFHIPPYKGSVAQGRRTFLASLKIVQEAYYPDYLLYMGGKVDTRENRYWYEKSKRDFVLPFTYWFPGIRIKAFVPTADQSHSTVYMDEEMNFIHESFKTAL